MITLPGPPEDPKILPGTSDKPVVSRGKPGGDQDGWTLRTEGDSAGVLEGGKGSVREGVCGGRVMWGHQFSSPRLRCTAFKFRENKVKPVKLEPVPWEGLEVKGVENLSHTVPQSLEFV